MIPNCLYSRLYMRHWCQCVVMDSFTFAPDLDTRANRAHSSVREIESVDSAS